MIINCNPTGTYVEVKGGKKPITKSSALDLFQQNLVLVIEKMGHELQMYGVLNFSI